jgi:NAD(P)-dependent dehydrogenase (short-subunit alcohol dehydrogenase family)
VSLEPVSLDLASLASVREAAARIVAAHPRVDILVNNAGVMATLDHRTEDGFKMQLGVNHLGHFALTALLLPALLESDDARVVSVTSTGRHSGRRSIPRPRISRGGTTPGAHTVSRSSRTCTSRSSSSGGSVRRARRQGATWCTRGS